MDIPPEVVIKATIRYGSVFYFPNEKFSSPFYHYFIVINSEPISDRIIYLICASSQIHTVNVRRKGFPPDTLVRINPNQYSGFTFDSILDCNDVHEQTIDELVKRLSDGRLTLMPEMDGALVDKLRQGVLSSPLVSPKIKSQMV